MINIKNVDPSLTKIDKKIIQKHWYLSYRISISDCENIISVNLLLIGDVDRYIEESNGN